MSAVAEETLSCPPTNLNGNAIQSLVHDLHKVSRKAFWIDFLASSISGWIAFFVSTRFLFLSWQMLGTATLGILCLYRSLCFIHELSHQNSRTLPGFETAYNALIGFPFLMPSFTYLGVHQNHHKLSTYGTGNDPEYLPFARSWLMTTLFALEGLLIPVALLVRFLLVAPIALFVPEFQEWVTAHASSLTMNVRYRREVTPALRTKVKRDSAVVFLEWVGFAAFYFVGLIPIRVLGMWFLTCSVASFINSVRTLGAHAYESEGHPLDRMGQLQDSIDTPGAFWTELWAPVGLRYHALHHYFPGIPYHNLPEAYRRLTTDENIMVHYRHMTSRSLLHSLRALLAKGFQRS